MTVDPFFSRIYNETEYNCAHFAAEVWQAATGQDIRELLAGFLLPPGRRIVNPEIRRSFLRLRSPGGVCLVLMHRNKGAAHVGVFIKGRVLHIRREGVGFQLLEIATLGFKTVRFYDVKNGNHS